MTKNNNNDISVKEQFDMLMKTEKYQVLLKHLSDDEREDILKALKQLVGDFETNVINPLKILKNR